MVIERENESTDKQDKNNLVFNISYFYVRLLNRKIKYYILIITSHIIYIRNRIIYFMNVLNANYKFINLFFALSRYTQTQIKFIQTTV